LHRRDERKAMIGKRARLPVTRQCDLLDLNRSGIYYKPIPLSMREMELLRRIGEIHLSYPFYGSRKIRDRQVSATSVTAAPSLNSPARNAAP